MFKSRDGTYQQLYLLRFVLCMHWHIHFQQTQVNSDLRRQLDVPEGSKLPVSSHIAQTGSSEGQLTSLNLFWLPQTANASVPLRLRLCFGFVDVGLCAEQTKGPRRRHPPNSGLILNVNSFTNACPRNGIRPIDLSSLMHAGHRRPAFRWLRIRRHSLSKMSRWLGPEPTMCAVARSTSAHTNAKDCRELMAGRRRGGWLRCG